MVNLIETGADTSPKIVTEKKGIVSVGRLVIPTVDFIRWEPSTTFLDLFNALNGANQQSENPNPAELRRRLTFSLNHNTPNKEAALAHERPVSAYFTHDPQEKRVIVEWGAIDPKKGEAKLHTYLNQVIDYATRVKQGMKLSSGHIARISATEEEIYLALLDNLPPNDAQIPRDAPMGKLVNTLHFSGFIPIAADGSVRLPSF